MEGLGDALPEHQRALYSPAMACTATLRKPLTSPFSLTMATRCTRGTGYSRLLRYTKALGTAEREHREERREERIGKEKKSTG